MDYEQQTLNSLLVQNPNFPPRRPQKDESHIDIFHGVHLNEGVRIKMAILQIRFIRPFSLKRFSLFMIAKLTIKTQ